MKRASQLIIAALGGLWVAAAQADEADPLPDPDFLEYLGSWQDSDEEWLIVAEWEDERAPRADGRPEAEANENE